MRVNKIVYRITHWETWPYLIKYIPILPVWLWYCCKARSLWFFTPSNPTITFGGFEGEGKKEMYSQLPAGSCPESIYILPTLSIIQVHKLIEYNQFKYPFAVKPNVGMMGFMFRIIKNSSDLLAYHKIMPVEYIVQKLIDYPLEVSVFYYRFPNCTKGFITGFIKKEFLQVTGNGNLTLQQLIAVEPRVQFRLEEMHSKHASNLKTIIPAGKIYILSYALNLSRGGKLVSLAHEIDTSLLTVFDNLNNYSKCFYYGRYDIKCASLQDLKVGKNFSILEYNGCGAEPHHIYGNGNTLLQAYRIVLHHWKVLYEISSYNKNNGTAYWEFKKGWVFLKVAKQHFKLLKKIDALFKL